MMDNKTSVYANSIFEQPWWLDIVAKDKWEEIIVKEEDEIVARWPIVKTGEDLVMPEITKTLGFWLSDQIIKYDPCFDKRKRITNKLLEQLPKNSSINIRLDPKVNYFLPMHWMHFTIKPNIIYRINDLTDMETVYNRFAGIVKENVKRSKKKVTIKTIDDIEILLRIMDKTFIKQNAKNPYSKDLLRNIYSISKDYNACKLIYAIGENGDVYSGILYIYDNNNFHALVGGTDPKYKNSGAFSLLLWEGIKFASTVSKSFDFGGSMVEGIENFMRHFGGEPIVYYEILKKKKNVFSLMFLKNYGFIKTNLKSLFGYRKSDT